MTDETFKLYLFNLYTLFFWLLLLTDLVHVELIFKGSIYPEYRTQNNNTQV